MKRAFLPSINYHTLTEFESKQLVYEYKTNQSNYDEKQHSTYFQITILTYCQDKNESGGMCTQ